MRIAGFNGPALAAMAVIAGQMSWTATAVIDGAPELAAWPAMSGEGVLYVTDGSGDGGGLGSSLYLYDPMSGIRRKIAEDPAIIRGISQIQLSDGQWAIIAEAYDASDATRSIVIVDPRVGVVRREARSVVDRVEGDFVILRRNAAVPVSLPLWPAARAMTGVWAGVLRRDIRLRVRSDGSASLVSQFAEKDQFEEAGRWFASRDELRLELEVSPRASAPAVMTWEIRRGVLIPKSWDRSEWGSQGLALRKR